MGKFGSFGQFIISCIYALKMVKIRQCEACGISSAIFTNNKAFNKHYHYESHKTNLKCNEKDCDKTFSTNLRRWLKLPTQNLTNSGRGKGWAKKMSRF